MPFMAAVVPGLIAGAATAGLQGAATAIGNEVANGQARGAREEFTKNLDAIKKRRQGGGGGTPNGGLGSGGLGGGFDTGGGQGDGRL